MQSESPKIAKPLVGGQELEQPPKFDELLKQIAKPAPKVEANTPVETKPIVQEVKPVESIPVSTETGKPESVPATPEKEQPVAVEVVEEKQPPETIVKKEPAQEVPIVEVKPVTEIQPEVNTPGLEQEQNKRLEKHLNLVHKAEVEADEQIALGNVEDVFSDVVTRG